MALTTEKTSGQTEVGPVTDPTWLSVAAVLGVIAVLAASVGLVRGLQDSSGGLANPTVWVWYLAAGVSAVTACGSWLLVRRSVE